MRDREEKKTKYFAPQTALHMAVLSNNTDDISEELAYLLENGGDVLIPGKDFLGNKYFVRDIKPPNNQ